MSSNVALLRTPTRRAKLIAQFLDLDLDPRFVYFVPAESQGPASLLYDFLRRCRATDSCYVMSAYSELDGCEMDLREALELTVNYDSGTLISCIPGELAYYEGDDSCRYILQRPANLDRVAPGRPLAARQGGSGRAAFLHASPTR